IDLLSTATTSSSSNPSTFSPLIDLPSTATTSTNSKYAYLKQIVFNDFKVKRQAGKRMSYRNLQKTAFIEARKLNLKKNCNSLDFVNSIKKKYRIVSRKVQLKRNFTRRSDEQLLVDS